MKTIIEGKTAEVTEKKSRFIANIFHVENVTEADEKIKQINKKYYDAKHNCYAYIVDGIEKCSDDGEPSKTAGAPILDILKKNQFTNVLVIVTRYFGGILLGTGGLVRAYSEATKRAIENSDVGEIVSGERYIIEVSYENVNNVLYWCNKLNIKICENVYETSIKLTIESTKEDKEKLINNVEIENIKVVNSNIFIEKRQKTT
ncbi:putative uncharacterized protein [Clostridium sp. CAG:793]|nr:putative uncharacterized protein [Clostridium sp. CAG:793]